MGRGDRAHQGKGPWAGLCPSHADILSACHLCGQDAQVGVQVGRASFSERGPLSLMLSSADSMGSPVPASWTLPALPPTASPCRKSLEPWCGQSCEVGTGDFSAQGG